MDLNTVYENILSLGTLKIIKNSQWYELSMFIVLLINFFKVLQTKKLVSYIILHTSNTKV